MAISNRIPAAFLFATVAVLAVNPAWAEQTKEAQIQYHVLAAELAGQRGDTKAAAREYFAAVQLSDDPALAERATRVALFAEDEDLALEAANLWLKRVPDSLDAHEIALGLCLRLDQEDAARGHASDYLRLHPQGKSEAFRQLARIIGSQQGGSSAGLGILEDLAAGHGSVPEASYAVGLVALRAKDEERALEALDRALSLKPGWNDAILLKTSALIQLGRISAAERTLVAATGTNEERAALHLTFARLLLEAGMEAEASRQFTEVVKLSPSQPDALHALALLAMQSGDKDAAARHFEALYNRDVERRDEAAYFLGTLAEERGDLEEAVLWYARVIGGGHEFEALQRRAYVLTKLGHLTRARKLLNRYRAKHPDQSAQIYLTEGSLLYEHGDPAQANEIYDAALQAYPNEPELLYGRSLVSERLGHMASAEQDLRRMLELNAEDPRALNALGYILSNHSERYTEALAYIEAAYKQSPEDPAINDSLGWIHYRLGDKQTALRYLEVAYARLQDPEVAAHYGEVLWSTGHRDQAQVVWRKALDDEPDHPVLKETVARLLH